MNKLKLILFLLVGGAIGFFIGTEYQKGWHTRTDLNIFCGKIGMQYLDIIRENKGITSFEGGGDWEKAVEIETQMVNMCNTEFN